MKLFQISPFISKDNNILFPYSHDGKFYFVRFRVQSTGRVVCTGVYKMRYQVVMPDRPEPVFEWMNRDETQVRRLILEATQEFIKSEHYAWQDTKMEVSR